MDGIIILQRQLLKRKGDIRKFNCTMHAPDQRDATAPSLPVTYIF